jgi:hypothetical protein
MKPKLRTASRLARPPPQKKIKNSGARSLQYTLPVFHV